MSDQPVQQIQMVGLARHFSAIDLTAERGPPIPSIREQMTRELLRALPEMEATWRKEHGDAPYAIEGPIDEDGRMTVRLVPAKTRESEP